MAAKASEKISKHFEQVAQSSGFNHAYLLTGPEKSGKQATLERLLAQLFGFKKADQALVIHHPDLRIIRIAEDKREISIDQVRSLRSFIQQKPFVSERKVAVIFNIENFSLPAANALLKTLEEPAGKSLLLLTAHKLYNIPETIISRCQVVKFGLKSLPRDDGVFKQFLEILAGGVSHKLMAVEELLAKDKGLIAQINQAQELLKYWQVILRDILLLKSGLSDKITYQPADQKALYQTSQLFDVNSIIKSLRRLDFTIALIQKNVNPKLALENFLLGL